MKKIMALILVFALAATMCACDGLEKLEQVELPPLPTVEPSQEPETTPEPEGSPEPSPEPAELGNRVIVSIKNNTEIHNAPDNEAQRILTFSYDTPQVHIEGNDAAAAVINDHIALLDELYYTGTGEGGGVNAMLEMALDNYSYFVDTGAEIGLEFSSDRTVKISRADSSVISLVFTTMTYTGGAHGNYFDKGYVYDAQTGELLTLDKLTSDYDAFSGFVQEYMLTLAKEDETYASLELIEDLPSALSALLREGSWYFDENGLVLFSDVYELASYAEGIIRFTIPYTELENVIDEKWLPDERQGGDGGFEVSLQSDVPSGSVEIIDKVTADSEGLELCLKAVGTVYDVSISSVEYADYSHKFFETASHWACSYMSDCAIQLVTLIPEGMPNLMISYTTADGVHHHSLISQSGVDGSISLTDAESVEAIG